MLHRITHILGVAKKSYAILISILLATLLLCPCALGQESTAAPVKIGVLAKRGQIHAQQKWGPTVSYLNKAIPAYTFEIIPLDFEQVRHASHAGAIDFLITNTAYYVSLKFDYGLSHIATMANLLNHQPKHVFGGVIFTKSDKNDINSLPDLKGRSFAAVDRNSLGGWLMAWREMHDLEINPDRDFKPLHFSGTHDGVVFDVLNGKTDAGTVRTDTLERMAQEGKIDLARLKILNDRSNKENFSYLLSTRLYPEWPFAKFKHTPEQLAKDVTLALLAMPPDSEAAGAARIAGWTVPLDYQPVHNLLKELHLSLYEKHQGEIPFAEILDQHGLEMTAIALLFGLVLASLVYTNILNRRLTQTTRVLAENKTNMEELVALRTSDLETEIAGHKVAEKHLQESELRTQFLWNNIPIMNFSLDTQGNVTGLNHFAVKELGYQREELIGMPVFDIFYETDRPMVLGQFALILQKPGKIFEWELRKIHKNGQIIWVKETAQLTKDGDGQPIVLVACQSIEPRRQAEKSLKAAYDIINKSHTVAFLWQNSPGWPVEFVSDNVLHLFGYTADEFKSGAITYIDTIHPDDQARVAEEVDRYSDQEDCTDFSHAPYRIITKEKETKWLADRTHIRRDSRGTISHYAGMIEDITNTVAQDEKLRTYQQSLEKEVKERTSEIQERNKELEIKITEIERINRIFVDRELRMVELKEQIRELENKLNSPGDSP